MSTRTILLLAVLVVGCGKESATTTAASDAAAAPSTTVAPTASVAPTAAPSSTVASPEALPSQADEATAAAKEITKANYKTELANIAATLK
jgi:PBP1b-binding outer membrane lipoprotein LpoB